ncbi:MAG TPA: DNA polymerase IV [Candidatus Dormibacteraeota bacterium]|nr:DNA polymerase IV [Candidatus Dormibacteraeota bacterium]
MFVAHFDVDAFYASVEIRDDPRLRGKPLAVAGSSRRAVVLTASYEARPFGVRSAVPLYRAREACPDLVVVPPRMATYKAVSREIFAIFGARGFPVEGLSLDEAFVGLGEIAFDEACEIARAIRAEVLAATRLTVSAGVASGKMVAKIASDSCKPDGVLAIAPGEEAAFLAPLSVGRLWGIGPKTQAKLESVGVATIGDLVALEDAALRALFGSWSAHVRDLARGMDARPVEPGRETKSISSEETFEYDVRDEAALVALLREQAKEIAEALAREDLSARTVGVKITRANFSTLGRQTRLVEPTRDARRIFRAAVHCLRRAQLNGAPVRLLGLRVASLVPGAPQQAGLFDQM